MKARLRALAETFTLPHAPPAGAKKIVYPPIGAEPDDDGAVQLIVTLALPAAALTLSGVLGASSTALSARAAATGAVLVVVGAARVGAIAGTAAGAPAVSTGADVVGSTSGAAVITIVELVSTFVD